VKAVAELMEGNVQPMSQLIRQQTSDSHNLIAGLQAAAARQQKEFSPFEGILPGNAAKLQLAKTYGPEHCWSVSRLEEYAYCPFRYFGRNVLKLEPLPDLALQTDYGRRGLLAHEALADLHRRLNAAGATRSPAKTNPEEFEKFSGETLAVLIERVSKGHPLEMALRTIDFNLIGQWLKTYTGQHERYEAEVSQAGEVAGPSILPAHFEVSFGLKRRAGEKVDPLSTDKPFDLVCGDHTIRLSGRIDRIDIGLIGGQVVFNVLDYKTGGNKKLKEEDIKRGLALQLPLYAMAVQELLMIDRRAMPWRVGYWYLKDKGFDSHDLPQFFEATANGLCETGDWHALRGTLLERVVALVQGIRGGEFPVFSLDKECISRCEFRTVCRIGQIRALDKTWPAAHLAPSESPGVTRP
jgi:ATP-dependent helicase/DNAse subunit B